MNTFIGSSLHKEFESWSRLFLDYHGLYDWHIEYRKMSNTYASCNKNLKRIKFSTHFIQAHGTGPEVVKTMLHEIAHAYNAKGHGHDRFWKENCLMLGINPYRLHEYGTNGWVPAFRPKY